MGLKDLYSLGALKTKIQQEFNKFQQAFTQHTDGTISRHTAENIDMNPVLISETTVQGTIEKMNRNVIYAPVMNWADFIALVNAQAALGRAVQMGPGTWTCDVTTPLVSGATIYGGPGVTINCTTTPTGGFTEFVFYRFATLSSALGTLSANATLGLRTLSSSVSIAAGTQIWVGQTAGTGHPYLAAQYTVQSVSGIGPYTLTLDRAVRYPFVSGDEIREITDPTENITIEGRGLTITGVADRAIEFTGARNCIVREVNFSGATSLGVAVSFDIGSLDCILSNCVVNRGSADIGFMLESAEHCTIQHCRVAGTQTAYVLYDCTGCSVVDSDASGCSNYGLLLSSNSMTTAGCYDCHVIGGEFSACTNVGLYVVASTDAVLDGCTALANAIGIDVAADAVRARLIGCKTQLNTSYGFGLSAPGITLTSPVAVTESYGFYVKDTCTIIGPTATDFTSRAIFVPAAAAATTRLTVIGGLLTSGRSGTICCDFWAGAGGSLVDVVCAMTSGSANQIAVSHKSGVGPVWLSGVRGTQSSASSGYVGETGVTVRWDGQTDFSALTTKFNIHGSGYGSVGTLVANGAGTAQDVTWPDIKTTDHITWTRTVNGGTPGIMPLCTKTTGTKFTATFSAGDTSTYEWRIE